MKSSQSAWPGPRTSRKNSAVEWPIPCDFGRLVAHNCSGPYLSRAAGQMWGFFFGVRQLCSPAPTSARRVGHLTFTDN